MILSLSDVSLSPGPGVFPGPGDSPGPVESGMSGAGGGGAGGLPLDDVDIIG